MYDDGHDTAWLMFSSIDCNEDGRISQGLAHAVGARSTYAHAAIALTAVTNRLSREDYVGG